MNAAMIFGEHLEKNPKTGTLEWKPGTPDHVRAAGRGYRQFMNESAEARLPHAREEAA